MSTTVTASGLGLQATQGAQRLAFALIDQETGQPVAMGRDVEAAIWQAMTGLWANRQRAGGGIKAEAVVRGAQ